MKYISAISLIALLFFANSETSSQAPPTYSRTGTFTGTVSGGSYYARDGFEFYPGFSTPSNISFSASIIEGLSFDVVNISSQPDMYRSLDKTLPVGNIPASFNVSPSGAATYTIPVDVPPGTAGMQPTVAVAYSSQAGNGLLGMGFNLVATSAVSRTGSNIYNDGVTRGVELDASDNYTLNGSRLISMGLNALDGGKRYRTEIESYNEIRLYDANNNGIPEYFKVWDKNGNVSLYGNQYKQYIGSSVVAWYLEKVTDIKGNYMNYIYSTDATTKEVMLSEIQYATSAVPYNSVKFFYEKRTVDHFITYKKGNQIQFSKLLVKIATYCEGLPVKQYYFNYHSGTGDNFTYLHSVELKNANNDPMANTTIFNWKKNNKTWQYDKEMTGLKALGDEVSNKDKHLYTGDFNGDGITDVLKMYNKTIGEIDKAVGCIYYGEKPASENSIPSFPTHYGLIEFGEDVSIYNHKIQCGGLLIFDSDNDGRDDYYNVRYHSIQSTTYIGVYQGDFRYFGLSYTSFVPLFSLCDLNGDGKSDFFCIKRNDATHYEIGYYPQFVPDGPVTTMIINKPLVNGNEEKIKKILLLDLNNDGLSDLIILDKVGYYVYYNRGYNNAGQKYFNPDADITGSDITFNMDPSGGSSCSKIYPGDYNGDGLTDLFCYVITGKYTYKWVLAINKDNGFVFYNVSSNIYSNIMDDDDTDKDDERDYAYIMDINKDGKSDIIIYDAEYTWSGGSKVFSSIKKYKYVSNGTSFSPNGSVETITDEQSGMAYLKSIGDFNGDGSPDLIHYSEDNDKYYCDYSYNTFGSNCIGDIKDGMNNYNKVAYKRTTLDDPIYSPGVVTGYPYRKVSAPLNVVEKVTTPDGIGGDRSISYSYYNAVAHLEGKGFLGFEEFTSVNNATDIQTDISFEFDHVSGGNHYCLPLPEITETRFNGLISKVTNEYELQVRDAVHKAVYPLTKIITDWDRIKDYETVKTVTGFDATNGNVTKDLVEYFEGGVKIGSVQNEYLSFSDRITANGDQNTLLNKPSTIKVSKNNYRDDSGNTFVNQTYFTYYTDGFIDNLVSDYGLAKSCTTKHEYNSNGTLKKTTLSASGLTSRYVNYTYEAKGRFMTKETNSLGYYTEKSFDARNGSILTEKDWYGNITTYTYDDFFRPVQVELPTGVVEKSTINWYTGTKVANESYYVSSYIDNVLQGTFYYDDFGREVKSVTKNINTSEVNVITTYNSKGQVEKVTDPYKTNGTIVETKYYYDVYGRPDYEYYKNVLSIDYDYSEDLKRCVTITNKRSNPNQVTKKRIDAMGNVRYAIDAGGTITYKYASSGGVKEITAPGSTVNIVYDSYGRQQTLTDPDAGTYGYGYNAFGELVSETDNMGRTFIMQYDELGRLVYKDFSYNGGYIIYEYGTSGNEKGRLKKVTAPMNGYSYESYTYDEPGNIITRTNYIESGKSLTTSYEYNNYGELTKTTYPSGFAVKNTYNNLHYLTEVRRGDNNVLIWKAGTMNALGQWDNYTLGNNLLMREFSYDSYNLPQSIKTKKIINGQYIQNLGYLFNDSTGNLTWRKDNLRSLTEAFVYDELNRLEEIRLNGTLTNTITYDNAKTGNIESTTLAGAYKYEGIKPHAVTKLDNANPNYPGQSQTVSYTNFNKVSAINNALGSVSIIYGPHNQRVKMSKSVSGVNSTAYYDGGYEEHIKGIETRKLHYIAGGDGLCAIYEIKNGSGKMHYVLTDHLGSYDKIYDDGAVMTEEYSFDAWGRRRNPTNWTYSGTWTYNFTSRGFTSHEHLDGFDVINMNGRCYDPNIGRFLSPDNYVQMPDFTQNFNRYAYCINNPLKYTDPSGEVFGIDDFLFMMGMAYIGGVLANVFHAAETGGNPFNPGDWNWSSPSTYIGMATGGISGAGMAGYQIPTPFPNLDGIITRGAYQAGVNVGINGIANTITGGSFFDNWGGAALSGFASGAITGYRLADKNGANYLWGTPKEKWGWGRTQWSITPQKIKYTNKVNFKNVKNHGRGEILCTMKAMQNAYGCNEIDWYDYAPGDDYVLLYNVRNEGNWAWKYPPEQVDIGLIESYEYYNGRMLLSDDNHLGNSIGHMWNIKKAKWYPGSDILYKVIDPYDGTSYWVTIDDMRNYGTNIQVWGIIR